MATILRDGDLSLLDGTVAVVGYGSQGHAHALNLHDSGVRVVVGLREGSSSWSDAEEAGLEVRPIAEAVRRRAARLAAPARPGAAAGLRRARRAGRSTPDATVLFAHGFNVLYDRVAPAAGHDVIMVAPKGPGPRRPPPVHRGLRDARADRGRAGRIRPRARHSRSPTRSGSARAAPGSSRRRSARRPRPTSSASRPCSAAARRS